MAGNKNLSRAKNDKNDEFYTRLEDIENELYHYEKHFKNKVVFCNCDDPVESMFWFYFHKKFESLGLKRLISTHYNKGKRSFKLEYTGGDDNNIYSGVKTDLVGDGDFRSEECIELLKEADIIVSNPPFSKFREYIDILIKHKKKFLIIGNQNAVNYKNMFPLFKENKLWIGYNKPKEFYVPEFSDTRKNIRKNSDGKLVAQFGNILWFTNMDIDKRHRPLDLVFFYEDNPEKYSKYDNYDAINIDKITEIPSDYKGLMGVPITFIDKYCPDQFEIIGHSSFLAKSMKDIAVDGEYQKGGPTFYSRDITKSDLSKGFKHHRYYGRIVIKNKNPRTKKEVLGL